MREEIPSGAKSDMCGPNPHGFINYSADGRMIALITRADRKAPADGKPTPAEAEALYRSMMSYAGAFTIEGNVVTHDVDISWNQSFTGGKQTRFVALRGRPADPLDAAIARPDRRQDERAPDDVAAGVRHPEVRASPRGQA